MGKRVRKRWMVAVTMVVVGLLSTSCAAAPAGDNVMATVGLPQESGPVQVPVYVLIYGVPFIDIEATTLMIMDYLERGTMYHGSGEPFLDFEIYKIATARPVIVPKLADGDLADYEAIFFDNSIDDLCALAREGKIKEVWVWGNGIGGQMREAVSNGPLWHHPLWTNAPDCSAQVTTVFNHFRVPVAVAVEAHIHLYEQFFSERFSYAFNKQSTIPYTAPGAPCEGSDPDDEWGWCVEEYVAGYYGVTDASAAGYSGGALNGNDIAQCGWAHYPPNITWEYRQANGDVSRYVYDYIGTVLSTCRNWRLDVDQAEIAEEINCTAWGCDKPGNDNQAEYFVWWMQNIPGPNNTNYDENGDPMPNWWAALYPEL